jgi:SlyX protein
MTELEERLVDIEIKLTRQEDITDALNNTIYQQQKKIDELEILLRGLAQRLKEAMTQAREAGPANERPPHY